MQAHELIRVQSRFFGVPLLIEPKRADVIADVILRQQPHASQFIGSPIDRDMQGRPVGVLPYRVDSGVAILSAVGELVDRGAWVGADSGLVSYEGMRHQLEHAARNTSVSSIVLDLSSPGGEAAGAFTTAALVRRIAGEKQIVAVVNSLAASAAYAIAASASQVLTLSDGFSGSIGVVLVHRDMSQAMEKRGVTTTLIFAGKHKVDGNPFEALSEDVRSALQVQVDKVYGMFVASVAEGRGRRMSAKAARETEAQMYMGEEAVAAGLADAAVASSDEVVANLAAKARRAAKAARSTKGASMSGQTPSYSADNPPSAADVASAQQTGRQEGALAATQRLNAIFSHANVKDNPARMSAALSLATSSPDMSAESVVAFVTAHVQAPAAAAEPPAPPAPSAASLAARDAVPDSLGALAGNPPPAPTGTPAKSTVASILANQKAVTGYEAPSLAARKD